MNISNMQIGSHHLPPPAGLNAAKSLSEQSRFDALATPNAAPGSEHFQAEAPGPSTDKPDDLKAAFHDFVGQTFFGEMIKSFRSTQQPSKYFHGGRAEEIFQGQFDQVLTEKLSDASAAKIADPMYDLFMLKRAG